MARMYAENGKPLWLKKVLYPFWIVQMCFSLILVALFAFIMSYSVYGISTDEVTEVIYLVINLVCLVFDIAEIILFARGLLRPGAYLGLNIAKIALWTITLILVIVSIARTVSAAENVTKEAETSELAILGLTIIIFLAFLGSLIYASVIHNQHMKAKKAAKANGIFSSLDDKAENGFSPTSAMSGHTYIERKNEMDVPNNGLGVVEADSDTSPTTFEADGKPLHRKTPAAAAAELDSPEDYEGGGVAREFGFDEVFEMPSSSTRPNSVSKLAPATSRLLTRRPTSSDRSWLVKNVDRGCLSAADAGSSGEQEHERGRRRT